MNVVVRNHQVRPVLGSCKLRQVAEVARGCAGGDGGTIGFAFVDDVRMADHHLRFLGKDTTTDVLSFPVSDVACSLTTSPPLDDARAAYWGDVMICTDQAARQARDLDHPYRYELIVLALHGVLHLLGYDHTSDDGTMSRLERALRPRCVASGPAT